MSKAKEYRDANLEQAKVALESECVMLGNLVIAMVDKLIANRHKGHWGETPLADLYELLCMEVVELSDAILEGESWDDIRDEAADVACFAGMIAERAQLKSKEQEDE